MLRAMIERQNMGKRVSIFGVLLLAVVSSGSMPVRDEYWICFSGPSPDRIHPPGGPWELMKIDALGNVIIPRTVVVHNGGGYVAPQDSGAGLCDNGKGALILWIPTRPPLGPILHHVYRAAINKRSLKLISLRKTGVRTANSEHIQVTQSDTIRLLTTVTIRANPPTPFYVANALSAEKTLIGQRWLLTNEKALCFTCGMGLDTGEGFSSLPRLGTGQFARR